MSCSSHMSVEEEGQPLSVSVGHIFQYKAVEFTAPT